MNILFYALIALTLVAAAYAIVTMVRSQRRVARVVAAHHERWNRLNMDPRTWDDDELVGVGPLPSFEQVPAGEFTL